ncbi:hypothetical protein OUZ56_007280 [Daphnia magna]|uniref:Uncharacterized protein n=1 Tax=Daphnia magna TaxID=35525 RepID=A0ABQ9YY55_9CRUS|nr:hypothetical protein OUZ56_007280 [Daphnia magna]
MSRSRSYRDFVRVLNRRSLMRIMHRMLPKNWQVYSSLLPMAVQPSTLVCKLITLHHASKIYSKSLKLINTKSNEKPEFFSQEAQSRPDRSDYKEI